MKITQDDVVERQTVLHIELEDDDIDPYLNRAYQRVVQRAVSYTHLTLPTNREV